MTTPLPKWLTINYATLWNSFSEHEFAFKDAVNCLNENEGRVRLIMSKLKAHGWLKTKKSLKDARVSIYHMKPPEDIIKELAPSFSSLDDSKDIFFVPRVDNLYEVIDFILLYIRIGSGDKNTLLKNKEFENRFPGMTTGSFQELRKSISFFRLTGKKQDLSIRIKFLKLNKIRKIGRVPFSRSEREIITEILLSLNRFNYFLKRICNGKNIRSIRDLKKMIPFKIEIKESDNSSNRSSKVIVRWLIRLNLASNLLALKSSGHYLTNPEANIRKLKITNYLKAAYEVEVNEKKSTLGLVKLQDFLRQFFIQSGLICTSDNIKLIKDVLKNLFLRKPEEVNLIRGFKAKENILINDTYYTLIKIK